MFEFSLAASSTLLFSRSRDRARNTPTQLSRILDLPPGLRRALGAPFEVTLYVDDFAGSVLGDREAPSDTRALVEIARALLHAYRNPSSLTKARIALLAPQFDILLKHNRPDDVSALWMYVVSAFEVGSPVRAMIEKAVSKPVREVYMALAEELLARGRKVGEARGRKVGEARGRKVGEARGRARGMAEALLRVLEHRDLPLSKAARRRVLATRDEPKLQRWFDQAFTIASAKELFEPREA